MLTVCVPVLRRYDMLREMLLSLKCGTLVPDAICVINNGRDRAKLAEALDGAYDTRCKVTILHPKAPMGVGESWNWFIANTDDDRVITNDDILFLPRSLETMVASTADLIWASGFSCFLIRDACVEKVGLFDESISPGYGYYEDDDYLQRLDGRGTRVPSAVAENVEAGVIHRHSATLQAATYEETCEHHRRFKIAQSNYVHKYPHVAADFPDVKLKVLT